MSNSLRRYYDIIKSMSSDLYKGLGEIELIPPEDSEENNIEKIKITFIPKEGIHADLKYTITIKFRNDGEWPLVYIDSEIYDKIKTTRYLNGKGKSGEHKGICIHDLGHGYTFATNFKNLCGNKWENYIYNLIIVFNNLQDFEGGNGIRRNYKELLSI